MRNAASLSLKISADILRVVSGDLALNRGRMIRLFADVNSLGTFMQYSITFCSRPEVAVDVVSGKLMWYSIVHTAV